MINAIRAIFYKNLMIYSHNKVDTASMFFRTVILILMMSIFSITFLTYSQKKFLIISIIILNLISNTIILASFEISKDVNSGVYTNILMSPVSKFKYFFSHALFSCCHVLIETILFFLIFVRIKLTFTEITICFIFILLITGISLSTSILLSLITVRMKTFRYTSAIVSLILTISGSLYPINILPKPLVYISKFIPFSYGIEIIRTTITRTNSIYSLNLALIFLIISNVLLFAISYLATYKSKAVQ